MNFHLSLLLSLSVFIVYSCHDRANHDPLRDNKLNSAWLEDIISKSDSSYSKPYYRSDFSTAYYYINKKENSLCQVMKDTAERVRQIIIEKNNVRNFYAGFYANGQVMAILPMGSNGRYDGKSTFFYEDGTIKSKGIYRDGFNTGEWKLFDEKGTLKGKEVYDSNGQLLKTVNY